MNKKKYEYLIFKIIKANPNWKPDEVIFMADKIMNLHEVGDAPS